MEQSNNNINILFLGSIGEDKSSLINLINFWSTISNDLTKAKPGILEMSNEKEDPQSSSRTLKPYVYSIQITSNDKNYLLNLIDTPGLSSSFDDDTKNVNAIL